MHEDIHYFSYKMRKIIFIIGHKKQEKRPRCKDFEQTQVFPPTELVLFFLRWEKLLPEWDYDLIEQSLAFSVPTKFTDSDKN